MGWFGRFVFGHFFDFPTHRLLFLSIPKGFHHATKAVITLLHKISAHSKTNGMTAEKLAAIFGPFLLRPSSSSLKGGRFYQEGDARAVQTVVEMLIVETESLWKISSDRRKEVSKRERGIVII